MKKKFITSLVMGSMLFMSQVGLFAGRGDAAAGVAAGLIGGAMITGMAAGSGRRARRAEDEARRAQEKAEAVRQEQQRERIYDVQRQVERQYMTQQAGRTINILVFAILLLFLGFIGLAFMVLKKK
jgi:Flp pilus assembly protein TadB